MIGAECPAGSVSSLVRLQSGARAVYVAPANHLTADGAVRHGRQLAHEKDGRWYFPGGWREITDPKTVRLLESCPALE